MKRMIASIICCIVLLCVAGYIVQMMFKLDTTFLLQAGAVFLPAYIIAVISIRIYEAEKEQKNNFERKANGDSES